MRSWPNLINLRTQYTTKMDSKLLFFRAVLIINEMGSRVSSTISKIDIIIFLAGPARIDLVEQSPVRHRVWIRLIAEGWEGGEFDRGGDESASSPTLIWIEREEQWKKSGKMSILPAKVGLLREKSFEVVSDSYAQLTRIFRTQVAVSRVSEDTNCS